MFNIFNYFKDHWMYTITPQNFSMYECSLEINYTIETYHIFLQNRLGVHPPVWTFYGKYVTNILFLFLIITVLLLDRLRSLDLQTIINIDESPKSQSVCFYYKT